MAVIHPRQSFFLSSGVGPGRSVPGRSMPACRALLWALCCLCLCACGPKEIGEGSSSDAAGSYSAPSGGGHTTAAEMMRYPMTGASPVERRLYYSTRPDIMERVQDWRLQQFRNQTGMQPSPEDPAYRAVPKQRSPFRQ